jgi:uncharacterized protein (TIGR02301 family)
VIVSSFAYFFTLIPCQVGLRSGASVLSRRVPFRSSFSLLGGLPRPSVVDSTITTRVPGQIALRRHRGKKISIRCPLAIRVGASIFFFFGASDIRSLPRVASGAAAPAAKAQAQDQPAPWDHDLQRLSEILGALHFLRGICDSNDGQRWRNEALALINAEAPNGKRRDDMVASFNRGYRGFAQSYHTCTPAADVIIRRYLEEGEKIARDITARYAN